MGCNKGLPSTCHTSWKWGWVQNINRLSKASDESPLGYHWVIKGGKHLLTIINLYIYIYCICIYVYVHIYTYIYIYIYMGQLEINYFEFRFNYLECNFFLMFFFIQIWIQKSWISPSLSIFPIAPHPATC